jgi:hypothetical protein
MPDERNVPDMVNLGLGEEYIGLGGITRPGEGVIRPIKGITRPGPGIPTWPSRDNMIRPSRGKEERPGDDSRAGRILLIRPSRGCKAEAWRRNPGQAGFS